MSNTSIQKPNICQISHFFLNVNFFPFVRRLQALHSSTPYLRDFQTCPKSCHYTL